MVALFSAGMWAATETTVYYAVPSSVVGSYTVKLNTNQQTNPDAWYNYDMTDTGVTYEGNPIYSATFTDLWDGVAQMQFQLYDGDNWVSQVQPIGSWTGVAQYNGKMWIHGENKWYELSGDEPDPTVAIKGAWDSWAATTPLVLSTNKETASLVMEMSEGIYEFGLEVNSSWTANGTTFTRAANSQEVTGSGSNMKLNIDADGEYTFTWTFETNTLTVTYPDVVVIPATFYVTGDSALVVDAGLDKEKAWSPSAIKATEDSYVLSGLKAGQEYRLKITLDGDWGTGMGCSDLSAVSQGITTDGDNNIIFKMATATDVTVTYKVVDETTTFTVEGDFAMPVVVLAGTFNSWSQEAMSVSKDKLSASITVDLTVGVDSFKIVKDGAWLSLYGEDGNYRVNRVWPLALDVNVDGAPNFVIDVDKAGKYTFRWEYNSNSLFVTFPELVQSSMTVVNPTHGTITVKDANGASVASGSNVDELTELTITATPDEGYEITNLRAYEALSTDPVAIDSEGKLIMPACAIIITAEAEKAAKFYITGISAEGEADHWDAKQVKVTEDSYTFENLAAGEYRLKVIPTGSWDDPNYGYESLTDKNDGLYTNANLDISFDMPATGDVTVEFVMDGDEVKTFTVTGDYYVPGTKTVKFIPWKWAAADAKFAAIIKGAKLAETWTPFFSGSGDTLTVEISDRVDSIKFVRLAPEAATPNWDYAWNNTGTYDSINSGLKYTINGWYSGTWDTYVPTVTITGWDASAGTNVALSFAADRLKPSGKLNLTKGSTYEFKVVVDGGGWFTKDNGGTAYNLHRDHPGVAGVTDWTWEDPGITVSADMTGEYEFTWLLALDSLHVDFPALPDPNYFLTIGSSESDEIWNNIFMEEGPEGVWSVAIDLEGSRSDYRFKIFRTWEGTTLGEQYFGATIKSNSMYAGNSTNWVLTSPGEDICLSTNFSNSYSFEFIPAENRLDVIFPTEDATGVENAEAVVKAVKTIVNGVLIIEKNGVKYNAQGQVVK